MKPNLLFVYGTLQKAYGNHRLIEGCPFLGKGIVKAVRRSLICIVPDPNGSVEGEVYQIDDPGVWDRVDGLEGHPHWYERKVFPIQMLDGTTQDAWVYIMNRPF